MIKIANAPCSWGVLEFDLQGEPATYNVVLDEIQQTGYAGTELGDWGFMPTDPARLKDELIQRNLQLLGAFVPVALKSNDNHQPGVDAALKVARLLSAVQGSSPLIVLADENGTVAARTSHAGRITPDMSLTEREWEIFAAGTDQIARSVREETGLRLVFHHHCGGYVEAPWEVQHLLSMTDPNLVGLCLDTGHFQFAGGDPLSILKEHGARVWHVHFKDCHPTIAEQSRAAGWDYFQSVGAGVFCELGQGAVDFPAVKAELERHAYDGWIVVEQDVLPGMGKPFDSALRNRQYLQSIGL
ncbi:MAG: TIM barrel protein [Anaerolineae bacterium]|nr:TIM barrel protein [Anaerolineae bacterium]